jgi:hypothetical protein
MLPEMSVALLEKKMNGEPVESIRVSAGANGFDYSFEPRGLRAEETPAAAEPPGTPSVPESEPEPHPQPAVES